MPYDWPEPGRRYPGQAHADRVLVDPRVDLVTRRSRRSRRAS
jgi:hypothetical protein